MRLLLDTHVVFWAVMASSNLSPIARAALEDVGSEVVVSVVSAWEIAIKVGLGKWPEAAGLIANFETETTNAEFDMLQITIAHVRTAGLMQSPHRDPFDRLLAAQARIEGLTLVTADAKAQNLVEALGAQWLW